MLAMSVTFASKEYSYRVGLICRVSLIKLVRLIYFRNMFALIYLYSFLYMLFLFSIFLYFMKYKQYITNT
jgi:hypothetical protein